MKHLSIILILTIISLFAASCTDGERMRQQLTELQKRNQADSLLTNDSLALALCDYFDSHGTANERLLAHYLLARTYTDMGEAPRALDEYHYAAECADTTAQDCDYHTLMSVYGQMSHLFHAQFLPDDEIAAIKMVAQLAHKSNDTIMEIFSTNRLTGPYYLKNDTDSILIVEKQARDFFIQHGNKKYACQAVFGSIHIALNRNNIPEAERLLNFYENESGMFNDKGELIKGGVYYVEKGIYLTLVGNLDSAQSCFYKAVNRGQHEGGYKGLLLVFEKKNLPDSVAKYARLFAAANDSSYLNVNQESIHRISALYNYSRQQKIAEEQAKKARMAIRQRGFLIGTIILLIIISFLTARRMKQRAREKYLKLSAAYDKSKAELAAVLDRQRLLRYDYEEALKGKDKKHQHFLTQIQEDIQQKEYEIQLLTKRIKLQEAQLQRLSSVDMEKEFKNSSIYRLFNERKSSKYIKQNPSEEDWNELTELFRTHYVRFNTFITYDHRLSLFQYRYCILFRLGFDNNEIGILMNKDKDQRYHLRKFICESLFGKSANIKMLESLLQEHF